MTHVGVCVFATTVSRRCCRHSRCVRRAHRKVLLPGERGSAQLRKTVDVLASNFIAFNSLSASGLGKMSSVSNSDTGASAAAVPSIQPAAPSINVATEWLDEDGRVCPKNVDYATQCPKGHPLAPFTHHSSAAAHAQQRLLCRVCHESIEREHASQSPGWFTCSVAGCSGGYTVCGSCATALSGVRAAAAASDDVPVLVSLQCIPCCYCCFCTAIFTHYRIQGISLEYLSIVAAARVCAVAGSHDDLAI